MIESFNREKNHRTVVKIEKRFSQIKVNLNEEQRDTFCTKFIFG